MSMPKDDTSAVRQVLDELRATGWKAVYLEYRETSDLTEVWEFSPEELLNEVMATDSVFVHVHHNELKANAWAYIVLGNDPEEVVADYTMNLDDVMNTLVERWMKR